MYGLRHAVRLAGARCLIMSLWKVNDVRTRELMECFYRRVLKGEPVGAALRSAQLAMKRVHADPRHWGAFVCQGDPGSLRATKPGPDFDLLASCWCERISGPEA